MTDESLFDVLKRCGRTWVVVSIYAAWFWFVSILSRNSSFQWINDLGTLLLIFSQVCLLGYTFYRLLVWAVGPIPVPSPLPRVGLGGMLSAPERWLSSNPEVKRATVFVFPVVLLGVGIWGAIEVTHPLWRTIILVFDLLLLMSLIGGWEDLGNRLDRIEKVTGIEALGRSTYQPGPSPLIDGYVCERCEAINHFDFQYPIGSMKCEECGYVLDEQFSAKMIAENSHDD